MILLGVVFSIINAFIEEILYRGIIWHLLLKQQLNLTWVLFIQAILFGLLHHTGFPGGLIGMIMSGGYAVLLGLLRAMTKSLFIPIMTHIFADLTIFLICLAWQEKYNFYLLHSAWGWNCTSDAAVGYWPLLQSYP